MQYPVIPVITASRTMPTAILTLTAPRGDAADRRVSVVFAVSGSFSVPVQRSMHVPVERLSNRRTEETV